MSGSESRPVQPIGEATARQASMRELRYALEALQADFDGKGSGPSGLRAQAMAHIKQALVWLEVESRVA